MESISKNAETTIEIKKAAVLIPLFMPPEKLDEHIIARLKTEQGVFDIPASTEILMLLRTDKVEHHKGQISFPGGGMDDQDPSLQFTALREFEEELGVPHGRVRVLKEMPEVPTFVTGYMIRPYVGVFHDREGFRPDEFEVAEYFFVPIAHLLDEKNSVQETIERGGIRYRHKTYRFEGRRIWGATARILEMLLDHDLER